MKKFTLLLLATLYFVCASGIYVHAHFCADELSSVSYFALNDNHQCGCGEEAPESDCCKDVLHFYKVDNHQDGSFVKASNVFSFKLLSLFSGITFFKTIIFGLPIQDFKSNSPPPYLFAKASKLIVNCVFRI